jgi:hypothetical protein
MLIGTTQSALGESLWTAAVPDHNGNFLTMPCDSSGPSRDIALRLATSQCVSVASDQILGDFHVQSLSVETQASAGFHQEVSVDRHVEGLTCQIQKQEVTENEGAFHAWVQCRFDLSKVKAASTPAGPSKALQALTGDDRSVILITMPQCDDLVIRGQRPRIVPCHGNPMTLSLHPKDQELIVRSKGYLPKHLNASELGASYEVRFEKL